MRLGAILYDLTAILSILGLVASALIYLALGSRYAFNTITVLEYKWLRFAFWLMLISGTVAYNLGLIE